MPRKEVLDIGRVDPPGSSELVAGQLASADPVADRPVGDGEVGGKGALGEEADGQCFPPHASTVRPEARMYRVTL